ncbi:MAG: hypothetical protein WAW07_15805 [Bacteroidales bacterium]
MHFLARLTAGRNISETFLSFDDNHEMQGASNSISIPAINSIGRKDVIFDSGHAVFLGDPVFHTGDSGTLEQDLTHCRTGKILRETDGFYYLLVLYHKERKLVISSGTFSILPVFYCNNRNEILISSSFDLLASQYTGPGREADRQYYVEKALFNYPLFNRTPLKGISLLSSNSLIEYNDSGFQVKKHTCIHDFFTGNPVPWRDAKDETGDLFIEKAGDFIPAGEFAIAMTGGLDSRSVIGAASLKAPSYTGYTYGQARDQDMKVASEIAGFLKLNFVPVILDQKYAESHFWKYGLKFLSGSHGLGNISRAHYSYIAENYLDKFRFCLSGNFGSEILRSAKIPGVVTSASLFKAFSSTDRRNLVNELRTSSGLNYLNASVTDENLTLIAGEIDDYLKLMPSELSLNQKFYTYVFEEVFRKYFGPEIVNQLPSVSHRAPFLCFSFIENVLKTGFAGANSEFMEANPLKRIQGQILHASIIQKTNPALLDFRLDRGYSPKDLLTGTGTARIIYAYLKKIRPDKQQHTGPGYLTLSVSDNIHRFQDLDFDDNIFDAAFINRMRRGEWISDQMNFINIMSAIIFSNMLDGTTVQD